MISSISYTTPGGLRVTREARAIDPSTAMDALRKDLKSHMGGIFASGYEYPGRYNRWDMGFSRPPVELRSWGRKFSFRALSEKGEDILKMIHVSIEGHHHLEEIQFVNEKELEGKLKPMPDFFPEEERSRQPSLFSLLRRLVERLGSPRDNMLGFYGAFGYDLVFQFEPIDLKHPREGIPDAALFFPDELVVVDRRLDDAVLVRYEFQMDELNLDTRSKSRKTPQKDAIHTGKGRKWQDHEGDEYAEKVEMIREGCRKGDFFEVVLSQTFSLPFQGEAQEIFDRIQNRNPSPYEFYLHLGDEQLAGASPEMFVRVEGDRVETCPISGTVPRGKSPMEDADNIRSLISSPKEEAELTMCTDVDRNDKSRVCYPESVKLLGRRLIEMYSKVIHTVDHVEGRLLPGRDGLDAFLSHMWAVTLTGSPKRAAMQTVENLEKSARGWYGGAVGMIGLNGDINTGITIRTVHLKGGEARVRVGATLLAASDPKSEQQETRFKASAFLDAITCGGEGASEKIEHSMPGRGKRVLFVDHQDSFVLTLAGYVRATGAEVLTLRSGFPEKMMDEFDPDLIFLSPGPTRPEDFGLPNLILRIKERGIPMFGVCLGLQGMVMAHGGELGILPVPQHGVSALIRHEGTCVFRGLPNPMTASRYHSLYALEDSFPDCFEITARSDDGVIMGIRHKDYPMAAVQFHPESIHTLREEAGMNLIRNMIADFCK